ncbi:probable RNA helicase armi [Nymphalis io]|uniref:probable RNA helicase armi n=1 Tax=Inachis io TaxID=171585 RepID=UPI0021679EFC|nr:probable RNA helicase armi [Nymphalis io]
MLSYIKDFFNYLINNNDDTDDQDKEKFLAHELVELEIQAQKEEPVMSCIERDTPSDAVCFKKTGLITYCENNIVLIDGTVYYDISNCSLKLNVNDKVLYLGYKDSNDSVFIVRILGNLGLAWGDAEEAEENKFRVVEHVLIGQVARRQDRFIYISESDLKFNLDDVEGTFVPIEGDWLEIICSVQEDSIRPFNISTDQVLKVIAFNAIRTKIKTGIVTQWSGSSGICDNQIYIDNRTLLNGIQPVLGSKVLVEAIESNQGSCTWRAIKLMVVSNETTIRPQNIILNEEQVSLDLEVEKNIEMTHPLKFDQICFQQTQKIILNIINRSNQLYVMNKWIILSKKLNSQIQVKPYINQPIKFDPGQKISFTVTCMPKFFGQSKESLVFLFKGFQLKRIIEINVIENKQILSKEVGDNYNQKKEINKVDEMKKIRDNVEPYIVGVKPYKLSAFVDVRIGDYSIPDKIWAVLLGDSSNLTFCADFNKLLAKIELNFPFLSQNLTINNYIDKWHTLLWMDEVQANLNMRIYDNTKAFLLRCDEYLGIEITKLTERRPSLIKGDRVIVRDVRNPNASRYEGYIHNIRGNLVLIKFHPHFHDSYNGGDVSIEFHFSRTMFRRSHHAINLALSNLGPDILFPSRIKIKSPQISDENLGKIKWFNTKLNSIQKHAVINILKGECRPMPYVIFGPPGTGKTVTLIETILQILAMVPESRILVATPSNSAANLITERLIQYKASFTGSIARIIANYLIDSESIPSTIKPYCVHFDISAENRLEKIQDNYQKTHICRHRVTIGTCYCLGMFLHLKLPKNHFTHIIIDEAGQATEPEIMVPMNFIHKEHGQIILAGDPMQLGPIILSKYCKEYGMDESFLCRLLDRFPYLKDYHSFQNGFDNRLVTMLNENYRSLKEIIKLASDMFYDGKLVAIIDESMPWTLKFMQATCEIFESNSSTGGIFVFGIKGDNVRAEDSPSWYNPQEAAMVALTTCKLYKRHIAADEIGIITPYLSQVKYLRILFSSMGLPIPKIGTVEDFQGQERPIILISTVRSTESLLEEDSKQALGFVGNPKRFNVALTRAQISTIIFCNPYLFSKDPSWKKVIESAVSTEKYMGCDLPFDFDNTVNNTY